MFSTNYELHWVMTELNIHKCRTLLSCLPALIFQSIIFDTTPWRDVDDRLSYCSEGSLHFMINRIAMAIESSSHSAFPREPWEICYSLLDGKLYCLSYQIWASILISCDFCYDEIVYDEFQSNNKWTLLLIFMIKPLWKFWLQFYVICLYKKTEILIYWKQILKLTWAGYIFMVQYLEMFSYFINTDCRIVSIVILILSLPIPDSLFCTWTAHITGFYLYLNSLFPELKYGWWLHWDLISSLDALLLWTVQDFYLDEKYNEDINLIYQFNSIHVFI